MSKGFKVFLIGVGLLMGVGALFGSHVEPDEERTSRAAPKHLNLAYGFSEGWLLSHDFYITNTSGEALTEVHLALRFVGEDASPSIQRYWSEWPLGFKQHVEIPADAVSNVQRIEVSGRADQGVIEASLTPEK